MAYGAAQTCLEAVLLSLPIGLTKPRHYVPTRIAVT